jgi:hypothetical protein
MMLRDERADVAHFLLYQPVAGKSSAARQNVMPQSASGL